MVDDKEFRKFVEMLNPGYQLPCRQTVSKNLIPRLYNCTLEQLKQQIQSSTAICLTTDGWTCINNRGYIAITAHYIEPNGTLSSICLSCEEFNERHTSTNLANYLKNITVEWDINYKIVAIVTDNAPNITAAVREMKYRHIGCFAHSINLLVQHSLEHISTPLKKVKCIVEFFKKSSSALAKLHSAQKNMGLPQLKLKQDVVTRWNSTYDMLKRIISIKDAVISTLAILQSSIQVLTPAEWEVVEKAVDVLQIFHEVTEEISSEKTVSISKVIVLVTSMFHTVETFVLDINIPYEVNLMANSLKAQLKKRFEEIEDNEIISQAAILDPRFKQFGFKNENKFNKALSILRTRISNIKLPSDSNPQKPLETVTSTPQPTSSLLWKVYENKVGKLKSIQNPTAAGLIELDKYMQEPLIDRHDDPLKWWYERKSIYPRLYTFVLKRLCITATSVPCERIFSEAGNFKFFAMKRYITMQNYFSAKKLNNENKSVDSSDFSFQGQDDITNNPEPELNTKISVASALKKCPGPSDISQNLKSILTFYPKTKYGDRWRHFSKQWFKSFAWLEYSILEDAVYCFPCRLFSKHFDNQTKFISLGFKNWKKATFSDSGLKKHDKSQDHKNCYVMWVSYKNMKTKSIPSVSAQINEGHLKLIRKNRKYIKCIASVLLYTGTQCIAQRGDYESVKSLNCGNFLELLHLIDEQCEVVGQDVPQNAKYTSPQIQNEMISIFNQIILEKISFELQSCNYFALIVDETKDKSKTEQLSVVVRYYIQGSIHERFMGFKPAKQLNASSLLNYIKEILQKCSVDLQKCVAQIYDGAVD
ncbi:hypothetical protein QTP88_027158 [Uroleucon formosanum]